MGISPSCGKSFLFRVIIKSHFAEMAEQYCKASSISFMPNDNALSNSMEDIGDTSIAALNILTFSNATSFPIDFLLTYMPLMKEREVAKRLIPLLYPNSNRLALSKKKGSLLSNMSIIMLLKFRI